MIDIPPELRNKCTSFLAHAILFAKALLKRVTGKLGQKNTYISEISCCFDDTETISSSLSKATLVGTTCKLHYSRESIDRIEVIYQLQTVLIRS